MYVIVEIAGQQFKAEQGKTLFVHHLNAEQGQELAFDKVLLVENENEVKVGSPIVEGAKVVATVVSPLVKGEKVIVFHKKKKKRFQEKKRSPSIFH